MFASNKARVLQANFKSCRFIHLSISLNVCDRHMWSLRSLSPSPRLDCNKFLAVITLAFIIQLRVASSIYDDWTDETCKVCYDLFAHRKIKCPYFCCEISRSCWLDDVILLLFASHRPTYQFLRSKLRNGGQIRWWRIHRSGLITNPPLRYDKHTDVWTLSYQVNVDVVCGVR